MPDEPAEYFCTNDYFRAWKDPDLSFAVIEPHPRAKDNDQTLEVTRTKGNIQLREALTEAREAGLDSALDMHEITHIDSAVIGELAAWSQWSSEASLNHALIGLQGKAYELLKMTGLLERFPVYEDLETARAGYRTNRFEHKSPY